MCVVDGLGQEGPDRVGSRTESFEKLSLVHSGLPLIPASSRRAQRGRARGCAKHAGLGILSSEWRGVEDRLD